MAILQSVSKTIRKMIEEKWDSVSSGLYLESQNQLDQSTIGFSTAIPTKAWAHGLSEPTINIYLYKVTENAALRSNEWRKEVDPATGRVIRKKPKTRINCSYIITAWSKDTDTSTGATAEGYTPNVEIQHKILSEVMEILTSYDSIPEECWIEDLKDGRQKTELPTAALLSDDVKSPGEFWTALDNRLAPFLHYVVTVAVTPKENKAQKDATPVAEVDLRSKKGLDMQMSAQSVGYYTIGGQVVGVPVGLVGNVKYIDQKDDEVTLDGEIQYQKDDNGDRILNQVVNTSHDFDELLDALYLDVYEQVRTAQDNTQYDFLADLDEYNRGRIENQIIEALKREKADKMQMLTKYGVSVDEFNRDKASCDSNGRYIFKGVPTVSEAKFSLFKDDVLITTETYSVPTNDKKRFELTASTVGQVTGFPFGDIGAINFTQALNDSATIKQVSITIAPALANATSVAGDIDTYLDALYDSLIDRIDADGESTYKTPDLSDPGYNLTDDEQLAYKAEIKAKMIDALNTEKSIKQNLERNYHLQVGSTVEALDNDGKAMFFPELFAANPTATSVQIYENYGKPEQSLKKSGTVKVENNKFTIDLNA